ncbi:hypothetical protein NDA11_004771 [Ustilago hordei]|nr:hypothetical protein NDA10_007673 [Ustilago hordei]KAJ1574140.1 hypothetical protein NDA12_005236 [Ustilago hordei]KAJ1574525.1 hypothetical protein NDA15_004596 [Ustilago hordei]KAJ1580352.1 hypothetical protein NDA11_004771 [Ustilago hordei]KAJ1599519.1 hypothetical protein NDA14_003847 [Ustilago hordei]
MYAQVCIPESELALGQSLQLLHLWSIHAPPEDAPHCAFWEQDEAGLSLLDIAAASNSSAAIIGVDWNAVVFSMLDNYPP